MTATPIPRSVAMTVFGDLETATLRELPAGRAEVSTVVVDARRQPAWVQRAWQRIVEEVGQGRQAYVVCARISSSERRSGAERATRRRPPRWRTCTPSCATGRWPPSGWRCCTASCPAEEKDAVMARFVAGEIDVLVATTVIEVGVDVPNASVMVISDADRFGISQLHQLRGRIGRGGHPGVCLLLTTAEEGSWPGSGWTRSPRTRDGFALAEVDLEQRREGDVLGASQSGSRSSLKLLRVLDDADLLAQARELAERCIAERSRS